MKNINIHFSKMWSYKDGASVCGTAFIKNIKITGETLCTWITGVPIDELTENLAAINGFFSAINIGENSGWITVDKIRSFPVFYAQMDGKLFISDDAHWVKKQVQPVELDTIAKAEFMLTGYVTGSDTLYADVKQVQAGELIRFHENENGDIQLESTRYYKYMSTDKFDEDETGLLKQFNNVANNIFSRLIEYADGRTIVVPLSGGYDSRFIAIMLKHLGYANVITYTYGKKNCEEAVISKTIAKALGYPWYFFEYTPEIWQNIHNSVDWNNYLMMAGNLCSLPHIQDLIAVRGLQDIVDKQSVVVPGIAADLNTGGFIAKYPAVYHPHAHHKNTMKLIDTWGYSLFYKRKQFASSKLIYKRIEESLADFKGTHTPYEAFEAWVSTEKVAKFVQNSVRAYELYNFDWWTPFQDNDFLDFWYRVNNSQRGEQKLYKQYLKRITENLGGLGLKHPLSRNGEKGNSIKSVLRNILPVPLQNKLQTQRLLHSYKNHPFQWFSMFNDMLVENKIKKGAANINSFIVSEYINQVNSSIK